MSKRTDPAFITNAERSGIALWVRLSLILAVGVLAGLASVAAVNRLYRNNLQSQASAVASVLDTDTVRSLAMPHGKEYDKNYAQLKQKMAAAKKSIGNVSFVYLMARDTAHGVYFLVDSEPKGSEGYSPNGQKYPEASVQLQASFSDGKRFVEGPVRDEWGTWLSALAPVGADSAAPVAMLGVDVPASSYWAVQLLVGGTPVLIAALAAGVVFTTEALRRRRQEALRMRSELVSIASHELRSPLAGLRWSQELMMSYPLDEKAKKSLEIMHNSTVKLQESIEDVLQLANLQSSTHQKLDLAEVNMGTLLADVFSVQQPVADEREISLVRSQDWPESFKIQVDERRMKRVFNNLVSNAIKYGKENTAVTVGYQATRDKYIISVSDHGIGIPKADQERVFSGFYRADNARRAAVDGTGMGLYLSRAIVQQHGGTLWLDSSEQSGTTVYVSLPITLAAPTTTDGR
ncbi:HAMP domain-containing histidine kinase [Candidatus Saccharibacteria bacterium]|nr:MAG: HAMP domain-containing histidine kinase [Candidatus Saccharibacteria bacterium]